MKEWQKVFLGFVAVLALAFVSDRMLGYVLEKSYKGSKYGILHRQEYCLHNSKDEILILGSSRAAHHYVPQVFIDSLGWSCYNCGSDGMCIYYHYAILSSYIERGDIPKIVLCEVMPTDAQVANGATFGLDAAIDRLAPNFGEYAEIDSIILLNGWKEMVKLLSRCYRFNSKAVQLIKCNFIPWPEDLGYEALGKSLPDSAKMSIGKYNNDEIEIRKLEYLRKLIAVCKKNDIQIVFLRSPSYSTGGALGIDTIKSIATENDVLFLDYVNDAEFMYPQLFQDEGHLNDKGAHEYSKKVVSDLKRLKAI